jgi:hypothetical protein
MIISEARFDLPGLPDVWFYPDDRTTSGFYAIPAHPKVATDSQGKPEISLVLYGSRKGSDFEAKGGIFTATVCLGLSSEQGKLALSLLAGRQASSTGRPQLLSPDWQQGEVELELARDLAWREKPSLVGDNRCSFNVKLSSDQAKTLSEAWRKGLPNSSIAYHVALRSSSGRVSKSEFGSRSATERSGGYVHQEHSSWERSESSAPKPYSMDIRGSINLPQRDLDSQLTTVGL